MTRFQRVATVGDLPPGEKRIVEVDGTLVVLVNCAGQLYAVEDVCTHDGGPLGEGKLEDCQLVCPRHGGRFDAATGAAMKLPAVDPVPTYEVRIQDGEVQIEVL